MKTSPPPLHHWHKLRAPALGFAWGCLAMLSVTPTVGRTETPIASAPLGLPESIPGNLALVPSVEWPSLLSVANLGPYAAAASYAGYADAEKCYRYIFSVSEPDRHFAPVGPAVNRGCAGILWSGNYLNWMSAQAIDPFRSALTGGYRVVDTPTETILEKAISDTRDTAGAGVDTAFPQKRLPETGEDTAVVWNATAARWGSIRARVIDLGNRVWLINGAEPSAALPASGSAVRPVVPYDPASHVLDFSSFTDGPLSGTSRAQVIYEISMRIKVCDLGAGLEANCVRYAGGYKPEGLIQQYSDRILFSLFSYLSQGNAIEPDGGVMRARQKFVGMRTHYAAQESKPNPSREWDPATGVLIENPDQADAAATPGGIRTSGVINYINRFGQMKTGQPLKQYDNLSELFYTVIRYFKNLGNVPEYSALMLTGSSADKYAIADGFPVITQWDDPLLYRCQINSILGIGDALPWRDKNLPGNTNMAGEPMKPAAVRADTSVDVVKALRQIMLMEGKSPAEASAIAGASTFTLPPKGPTLQNSAYIAALAFDSHTNDIRPDSSLRGMPGDQTISTHWVDVVTTQDYNFGNNMLSLAAKYGGFKVPLGFDAYAENPAPLPLSSWWSTGDYINGNMAQKRPGNYYTAEQADKMVASLKAAFAAIVQPRLGSGGAAAVDGNSLQSGATIFQSSFTSEDWSGDVAAYPLDPATGKPSSAPMWTATDRLLGPTGDWRKRKLFVNSAGYRPLDWSTLSATHRRLLGGQAVLNYLMGDRANEGLEKLRPRRSLLGDIVSSAPVYVGAPNPNLHQGKTFSGATSYRAFATAMAARSPVVYAGANDGFLHGFNATPGVAGGSETYGFMPNSAIGPKLVEYTRNGYKHEFTVDGEITVADAFVGGRWRTVLVGSLGRGGAGVYALDVTDPDDVKFLWEHTADTIPALGNTMGKPLIAQVANGQWRVVMGNGPNSAHERAALLSFDLASGSARVADARSQVSNGLSPPRLWDADGDGFTETAYAGDLKGGLWRFTLSDSAAHLLYSARSSTGTVQPITAAPLVARNPTTRETWVFVGTGQYLNKDDLSDKSEQAWYGLIDRGTVITGRGGLARVDIISEDGKFRTVKKIAAAGRDGWVMDLLSPGALARGERMVLPNQFQGSALVGTTRIPDVGDPCSPGGSGYGMAVDPFTGGRLQGNFFDANGDGLVNDADLISVNGEQVPPSGVLLGSSPNQPTLVGDAMQITLEDGSSTSLNVNLLANGNRLRRVSWREIVRWD